MSSRIEDYAFIGDCQSAALVARNGSIDWLCWPRFDSPACFAALLGKKDNGRWRIAPSGRPTRVRRAYRPGTLILETEFETATGTAKLIDFMPLREGTSALVRIVFGVTGYVDFRSELLIRFGYGSTVPWVTRNEDGNGIRAIAGPDILTLRTQVATKGEDLRTVSRFTVSAGEATSFVLHHDTLGKAPSPPVDAFAALVRTEAYWRQWTALCPNVGPYTEVVRQSLTVLKALTYEPTGGIVAAATTSLPEQIGGQRNWDYRFCWLRDAAFTLRALMSAGYYDEAEAWRDWLLRAAAGSPARMQILYGVAGERHLPEWEVKWLPGHRGSRPVRVGNAAADQLQLDVYGEVADAMFEAVKGGLAPIDRHNEYRDAILEHLERVWHEPDEGIWEIRAGRRHFTHSKVMCWVAFDRAARMAAMAGDAATARRWRAAADGVHHEVMRNGFNEEIGSFVQHYGARHVDASLLQIPLVGFLPAGHERMRGTVAAIERELMAQGGLVSRYRTDPEVDGLPEGEGAFLACNFWLADNYVLQGRLADAHGLFRRLLALRNDVGLLAEEYEPVSGRMLGNFPQAFSHVGLINTALNLAQKAERHREQDAASAAEPCALAS
ncbi:MAG TPA: glycoside hydrolase family 15 protein [Pseudolabrys sp.]|nr:glycoside hydrolase family 15 protein [Pseudolabrys sp.]